VLFEFIDLKKADDINVKIFEVDPRCLGFALCMIDYYFFIRAKSSSKAPFNLWPASPKFFMMKPKMIYWSIIRTSDAVETNIFPGRERPVLATFDNLADYYRSDSIGEEGVIDALAKLRRVSFKDQARAATDGDRRRAKLELIQQRRKKEGWNDEALADDLARIVYGAKLRELKKWTKEFAPDL
jgi:hypothetical protein